MLEGLATQRTAHYPLDLKAGDIVCLISAHETIIGRVQSINLTHVELYKPHLLQVQPMQNGQISVGFMPYGQLNFVKQRDKRHFLLAQYQQIDYAEEKLSSNFSSSISGIVTPARSALSL